MNNILDILIDNCTNERLDKIVFANDEYKKLLEQYNKSSQSFEDSLTPEQKKIFDTFTVDYNALSAMYARLAYEQGLRDIVALWNELTEK